MKRQLPAQIMVIVLLIISVLSIIALTVTLTTVRDTREQVQNKQYQQYYSFGERKLLDMQQALGTDDLSKLGTSFPLTSDSGATLNMSCTPVDDYYTCEYFGIPSSEVNGVASAEELDLFLKVQDTNYVKDFELNKDSDVLLDLNESESGTFYLAWNSAAATSWSVTYDYTSGGNYYSDKVISDFASLMGGARSTTSTCLSTTEVTDATTKGKVALDLGLGPEYNTFLRVDLLGNASCAQGLYLRIRAIKSGAGSITMALQHVGNTTPLMRTITSITSTASDGGSGLTDNPTAVLETRYLLTTKPLSLFDYVLRTDLGITKN